ncbi:MAG: hypothetical protein WC069_07190 [Candidatus Shapirobacteria bacterium]
MVAIISFGCAGSEVHNKKDYLNGDYEAGWWSGLSPEEMKAYIDGALILRQE